ncbi:MAG: hypothetical protein ACRDM1_00585 [Gaiellaceae bacterium]
MTAFGFVAVVLWIVGQVVAATMSDSLSDKATDDQVLAWVQGNANPILAGGWLFMIGCIAFVCFAAMLRSRLASADGPEGTLARIAFGGALAAAIFGMLTQGGDIDAAINKDDISAGTAGTLHHLGDAAFVCVELSAILLVGSVAVLGWRTGVVPKWWAAFCAIVGVVLVIGPIGWLGVIIGIPIFTIGSGLLLRGPVAVRSTAHATVATG